MTNTIELVKFQLSTLSIEELVIEKNNAVSLIETFVKEGNEVLAVRYLTELKLNIAANQSLVVEMEEMVNARFSVEEIIENVEFTETTPEEKAPSVVEVIADQLFEQGFYSNQHDSDKITVTGLQYDLSLTVLENGYELETYCTTSIEHFNTYEWANHKVVKTLRGLNGYLRRFGFGQITL